MCIIRWQPMDMLLCKNDYVKLKTGFDDLLQLLQYSAICYGGDLDWMARRVTKLDWLEELMLYYELTYMVVPCIELVIF